MSWHRPVVATLLGLAAACLLSPAALRARRHDNAAQLNEKIQRQTDPVKKARLQVRLARVELQQAVEAYGRNQTALGQKLLAEYLHEINTSWGVLKGSGRNASKKPSGFMQLEKALWENSRVLNDLRERVIYLDQGPIAKTLNSINQLHSQVLLALFPGAAAPARVTAQKGPKGGASSFAPKGPPS